MEPDTQELVKTLDELAEVLESDGDRHWSQWMRKAAGRLTNGDGSGVDYLLQAYGGMGSINDLVLGQATREGKFEWKPGSEALNERFEFLRGKAWQLAQSMRRSRRHA
jgi:hypothetical protein